ncbi:MAG: tetratricopeptide repeat protein [Candidatus Aenigmatarchaeota archaeon]
MLLFYSYHTFNQNKIWRNELILWETTVKREPYSCKAYNQLGIVYATMGKKEEAKKCFEKAIKFNEFRRDFYEPYNNLGIIYVNEKKLAEAEKCFREVLKYNDKNPDAYNNLGVVYWKRGNKEKVKTNLFPVFLIFSKHSLIAYFLKNKSI